MILHNGSQFVVLFYWSGNNPVLFRAQHSSLWFGSTQVEGVRGDLGMALFRLLYAITKGQSRLEAGEKTASVPSRKSVRR